MSKIIINSDYFNITDTLYCGQIFRFRPFNQGYMVFSGDKACYCYQHGNDTVVICNDSDCDYFYNYFDLNQDYSTIVNSAIKSGIEILSRSAEIGKGIRILNQDREETLFSFIVSQNNNIPRIKAIIEKLCEGVGEKKTFMGEEYFSFPSSNEMAKKSIEFYKSISLGYRAEYILSLAKNVSNNTIKLADFENLDTVNLKKQLMAIYGVGRKVCDCVSLFGFHRSDSFPVDTWIEKVYREDFKGELKDNNKIADFFLDRFGDNSGYFQQYLFYFKRSIEKKEK